MSLCSRLGNSCGGEAGGLGVAKQKAVKGISWREGKESWVFSLPTPRAEGSPAQEGLGSLAGEVQGPSTEIRFLLICNLKMHSKGSILIAGTLIRQSVGQGSQGPHGEGTEGAVVMQCLPPWEETCWMTILGLAPAGSGWGSGSGQGWLGQLVQGLGVIPLGV